MNGVRSWDKYLAKEQWRRFTKHLTKLLEWKSHGIRLSSMRSSGHLSLYNDSTPKSISSRISITNLLSATAHLGSTSTAEHSTSSLSSSHLAPLESNDNLSSLYHLMLCVQDLKEKLVLISAGIEGSIKRLISGQSRVGHARSWMVLLTCTGMILLSFTETSNAIIYS